MKSFRALKSGTCAICDEPYVAGEELSWWIHAKAHAVCVRDAAAAAAEQAQKILAQRRQEQLDHMVAMARKKRATRDTP